MTSRPELIEFYEHSVKPQVDEFLKEKGLPPLEVWQQVATEAAGVEQDEAIKNTAIHWQPIETRPMDGRLVLFGAVDREISPFDLMRYDKEAGCWREFDDDDYPDSQIPAIYTHWSLLTPPEGRTCPVKADARAGK